jgi:hypothetical protein
MDKNRGLKIKPLSLLCEQILIDMDGFQVIRICGDGDFLWSLVLYCIKEIQSSGHERKSS